MHRTLTLLLLALPCLLADRPAPAAGVPRPATGPRAWGVPAPATGSRAWEDPSLQRLEREMARLAKNSPLGPNAMVGACAIHIESGRRVTLNGKERFPMASTFKVPVAVQLLARVDQGELKLTDLAEVSPRDLHPGSGTLSQLFKQPGTILSVRNLLELMLLISDNSATDILVRMAGGPQAVTGKMRALGIEGIDVNRPTIELIADYLGVKLPLEMEWTQERWRELEAAVPAAEKEAARKRWESDSRDTATPEGMATLLTRLYRNELLKRPSTELLLDIMLRCQTGDARLKGLLPAGIPVAHKTGTVGGTTNDVGILTLPGDAGHVALAVFVKSSTAEAPVRERAIAEVARAVYDYFVFSPGP